VSKKIIYFMRIYQPLSEAISKEVEFLHSHFKNSFIYSMTSFYNVSSLLNFHLKRNKLVFCYLFLPLRLSSRLLEKRFEISHVFGNLNDNYYLKKLRKPPIIVTAVTIEKVFKAEDIKKVDIIITESKKQKEILVEEGVKENKIRLIYPPVDLNKFQYVPVKSNNFKILFASSPMRESYFERRGINLLLDVGKELPEDIEFNLLWRGKTGKIMKKMIMENNLRNFEVIDTIILNLNKIYAQNHVTIAPFTTHSENKSCPNSIIESLAAGKPVLVSEKVGISDIIKRNRCGIVFKPTKEELIKAIEKIQRYYKGYQKNCRKCAEKYFSQERFIKEYEKVYDEF